MWSRPLLDFLDFTPVGLTVQALESFDRERPKSAQIQSTFGIARALNDERGFLLYLKCHVFKATESHNTPYEVEFTFTGEFQSAVPLPPEAVWAGVANNALMLLYGAARGVIGQITGGGANGRFLIPTLSFDDLVAGASQNPTTGIVADAALERVTSTQSAVYDNDAADSAHEERAPARTAPPATRRRLNRSKKSR